MSPDFSLVQHPKQVKGIFPLSTTYFLYSVHILAGGFSLTFLALMFWYVCNLSSLSLLSKLTATPVANISHLAWEC